MKRLNGLSALFLVFLLFACEAAGQLFRQTLHIQLTNIPVTGNSITINGATRRWTNGFSPTTIHTNLTSIGGAKTNMFSQFASWPWSAPEGLFNLVNESTNSFKLIATLGRNLTVSSVGNWAVLTLSTQLGPQTYTALWPIANITESSNRMGQASDIVNGLNNYATNTVSTNATSMSNYLTKGASPIQHVLGPVIFNSITASNIMVPSNAVVGYVLTATSVGGKGEWQMVTGGSGSSNASTTLGTNGVLVSTMATQTLFYAHNNLQVFATNTSGKVSVGFGVKSNLTFTTTDSREFRLGSFGADADTHGVSFGFWDVTEDELLLWVNGSAEVQTSRTIIAPDARLNLLPGSGAILAVDGSGNTFRTNPPASDIINTLAHATNMINGSISYGSKTITTVAAGHNVIDIGTNTIAYLTSSPGAAWTLGGIVGDIRANRVCKIVNLTGYDCTVWNEDGLVPTAAQRILTLASYAGTNMTLTGNGVIDFIYSGSSNRWILDSDSADMAGDVIVNLLTYILPFLVVSNLTVTNLSLASLGTNASPVAFLGTDAAGLVYETAVPVKNVVSLSTSNATSKPLTNSYAANVLTLPGLEAGANVTLTANGSNWVIASTGGGGGGDVTTAQLNTASNAVWGAKQAGTFLLTNFTAMGISNILAGPGIAIGTNNGVLWITNMSASGLTNSDVYNTFEVFGHQFISSNLWVTGTLNAPAISVATVYANTLVLTNGFSFTPTVIAGTGGALTNFAFSARQSEIIIAATTNVSVRGIGAYDPTLAMYWTLSITNGSGADRTLEFSAVTNRFRFSGTYGTNAPTVVTNGTSLMCAGRSLGTNTQVGYTYFAWP